MTLLLDGFMKRCYEEIPELSDYKRPWEITAGAGRIVGMIANSLSGPDYRIDGSAAIHKTAVVEKGAVLKDAAIIGKGSFVAAGVYIRGGVYLGKGVTLGPGCEVNRVLYSGDRGSLI